MKMIRDWMALLHAKGVAMPAKLALAALIALAGPAGAAEPYPDHPITLIVPYAAGGSSDVLARLIGGRMPNPPGKKVVTETGPGPGSRPGMGPAPKSGAEAYPP